MMARGITPGDVAVPCMENVLPVPVIPYAKTVPWYPSITRRTSLLAEES